MRKLLASSTLILLLLTGCAGTRVGDTLGTVASALSNFSISQSELDGLRNSYNAAFLAPAANYRQLRRCQPGVVSICRDPAIVRQLQAIDKAVLANFNNVQQMLDSGNNNGLSAAWNVLNEAVSSAKTFLITNGIGA